MTRRTPFQPPDSFGEAIRESMAERMAESQKHFVETMISPENVLHYSHGSSWRHPALPNAVDGEMETHSAEFAMPFRRIVDGDLSILRESIQQVGLQMKSQFTQSLYGLMNETCERSGNMVSAEAEGGLAEAFESMLQKIEFGVDSKGNVSLPEVHVADAGPLRAALEGQSEEYGLRIEALIKSKSESALAEEAKRKAKFEKQP